MQWTVCLLVCTSLPTGRCFTLRWRCAHTDTPKGVKKADEWESGWWLNVECADTVAGRGQGGEKQSERVRRINQAGFGKPALRQCSQVDGLRERQKKPRDNTRDNYFSRWIIWCFWSVRVWMNAAAWSSCGSEWTIGDIKTREERASSLDLNLLNMF